jgi:hypothetical protein
MRAEHCARARARYAVSLAAKEGRVIGEAWATRDVAFRKVCDHEFEAIGDTGRWDQCRICARCRRVGSTKVLGASDVVKCCECGDIHKGIKREKRNGSHSKCPKCGHGVYVWP